MASEQSADALTVDKEFAALCGDLSTEELSLLESQIDRDGCLDPIILWANHDDTIIDGHHRYKICTQLGIKFKTKSLQFETRNDVIEWIACHQLGRRNASEETKAYLRGKRYGAEKKEHGAPEGNTNRSNQRGQNEPFEKTAAKLASTYNVSPSTIKRDAQFAEAVDQIATNVGPETKASILAGRSGLSKSQVIAIADEPAAKQSRSLTAAQTTKPTNGAIKTDVERLIESIEALIEKVNAMAARRMGHNDKSRDVLETLKQAVAQSKAMAKSWRNQ